MINRHKRSSKSDRERVPSHVQSRQARQNGREGNVKELCWPTDTKKPGSAARKADIEHAKQLGADGLVLGLLDGDGYVDVERTRELVEQAKPLPVTFHRAVDVSADFSDSLERIIAAGAQRVLTSGGRRRVVDSTRDVSQAIRQTHGRLIVMVGGGLNPENIVTVASETGAAEYHASLNRGAPSPARFRNHSLVLGANPEREYMRYIVREEDVRALREGLERANGRPAVTPGLSRNPY